MLLPVSEPSAPAGKNFFRPGSRWLAVGDSITESGHYMSWVEYFHRCRFGGPSLLSWNAGVGGDTATGATHRLEKELTRVRPELVSFLFGMNDVDRGLFVSGTHPETLQNEANLCRARFTLHLDKLITQSRAHGARVAVFSCTPFDHSSGTDTEDLPGVDAVLMLLRREAKRVAQRCGAPFVDIHEGMTRWIRTLKTSASSESLIDADRVHPTALGQLIIALLLFSELCPRSPDQDICIDSQHGTVRADNASVNLMQHDQAFVHFHARLSAAPVVLPEELAVPWAIRPLLHAALGRDVLAVQRLFPGSYTLHADGRPCGRFSHDDWNRGIALNRLHDFPLTRASREFRDLLVEKMCRQWEYRQVAWCEYMAGGSELNPVSADDTVAALRRIQVERPYLKVAIDRRLANYPRLKETEADLLREIDALEKKILAFEFPGTVECTIRSVDDLGQAV